MVISDEEILRAFRRVDFTAKLENGRFPIGEITLLDGIARWVFRFSSCEQSVAAYSKNDEIPIKTGHFLETTLAWFRVGEVREAKQEIVEVAIAAAKHVLQESISDKTSKKLAEEAVDKLV